jgi:anti-sigma B factor antagonist
MAIIDGKADGVTEEPHRAAPDMSASVEEPAAHVGGQEPLLDVSVSYPAPGVCVVRLGGELDTRTSPLVTTCLGEELAGSPRNLVLDLLDVRFIGSAGLYALFTARELAGVRGSVLHLTGMDPQAVERQLERTGLLPYFRTFPTLDHALSVLTS